MMLARSDVLSSPQEHGGSAWIRYGTTGRGAVKEVGRQVGDGG